MSSEETSRTLLPRPIPDADSLPFWAGCREHRLLLQRCSACHTWRYPPRPMCPRCGSLEAEWNEATGRGFVYSWVVPFHAVHPAVVDFVPYNIVLIELEEGPRMITNLLDTPADEIAAGQSVEIVFEPVAEGVTIPRARRLLTSDVSASAAHV